MSKILATDEELEKIIRENAAELTGFLDVLYEIEIRLGSTRMKVRELLELKEGDCITLDRPSSEYLIIAVDNVNIGEVEVVLTRRGTGARIVEIS